MGLRFKPGSDVSTYYKRLLDAAASSNGSFAVCVEMTSRTRLTCRYTHETMPERWHFTSTKRIAPIYIVPHLSWALTDHVSDRAPHRPLGSPLFRER